MAKFKAKGSGNKLHLVKTGIATGPYCKGCSKGGVEDCGHFAVRLSQGQINQLLKGLAMPSTQQTAQ